MKPNDTCPLCGGDLASYQVMTLDGRGEQERQVGCSKNNPLCLLAGHAWSLQKWDALCELVAAAGEGYPGAAHERLTLNSRLSGLARKWVERGCLFAEVHPSPAGAAFRMCAKELCDATGETGL